MRVICIIAAGLAFVWLIWSALTASFKYTVTPSEFLAGDYAGKTIKISGKAENVTFSGSDYRFDIADDSAKIAVHYKGTVPNTFRNGADVVVTGGYKDGVFEAVELITKCASKYGM